MITSKVLTGEQIVEKGATKLGVTLPELGIKDVVPNGSWLEQKQVQSALEARKHLIEVERIEKSGVLSIAEWREDLMLAQVTQKVGGYWHYLGHNVGKQLFLYPEEALFLMETSCLQLKLNNVTVSLQQAYSLLLRGNVHLHKFKVYASLSRLGYRLLRHSSNENNCNTVKLDKHDRIIETNSSKDENVQKFDENLKDHDKSDDISESFLNEMVDDDENARSQNNDVTETGSYQIVDEKRLHNKQAANKLIEEKGIMETEVVSAKQDSGVNEIPDTTNEMEWEVSEDIHQENNTSQSKILTELTENCILNNGPVERHSKLPKLVQRRTLNQFSTNNNDTFRDFPDLLEKEIVTINLPSSEHFPKNVIPKHKTYVLNLENIKNKIIPESSANDNRIYSYSDEVNGAHIRRVRNFSFNSALNTWASNYFPNPRFPRTNTQFRPFNFWHPRTNSNYIRFNLIFQRPFFPMFQNIMPRFNYFPRPPQFSRSHFYNNISSNEYPSITTMSRKRPKSSRRYLLNDIKKLAVKLKNLVHLGNTQMQNIQALQSLVNTYNVRYNTKLILTDQFEIIENENIVETIELDDDEESKSKKARTDETIESYEENLDRLKQLSLKLKDLEKNEGACTRRRRAFNKAIRTFNKSYNSEMYVNSDYQILDRRHITLESSSDSDCVIEEPPKTGKMLRNPFNILKRLSKNRLQTSPEPTTSKSNSDVNETPTITILEQKYSEKIVRTFKKNWLPNEEDFGRAEVPSENHMTSRLIDTKQEDYFYEFMTNPYNVFSNWLSYKIAFWEKLEESQSKLQKEIEKDTHYNIESIIKPEDCTETSSILKKLSIIKQCKNFSEATCLSIDFDVYNRDVQNFRKSNPPKPHFRLICINESTDFPSALDVSGLHSKYQDGVGIVFAIVGISSISYLQINPTETPLYLPTNEMQ